jgi:two-component system sensor histidine kinase KdpD
MAHQTVGGSVSQRGPARQSDVGRAGYAFALGTAALCTGLAWTMSPLVAEANLIMVYLLGVMLVAIRYGNRPALLASALGVLAFGLFFVPPPFSLATDDTRYFVTLAAMLLAAIVIGSLAARLRQARLLAQQREERTRRLYALSQTYASTVSVNGVLAAAAQHLEALFVGRVVVLLPAQPSQSASSGERARSMLAAGAACPTAEVGVAQWVYEHGNPAGAGTGTLPGARGVYVPLVGARGRVGVLGLYPARPGCALSAEQFELLQACANQTALAIERALLAEAVQRSEVEAASEQARRALLASVSHDLRTPLAIVMGSLSSILERHATLEPATREQLVATAYGEAARLDHLVDQLLAMTRLEAGSVPLQLEWQTVEEIIGAALGQLDEQLAGHPVAVVVPPGLPLVPMDGRLVTQVVAQLLENALAYTPPATAIRVHTGLVHDRRALPAGERNGSPASHGPAVLIEVSDAGLGLPPGDEARVFEKFYRGSGVQQRGAGLGLAICQGIVNAHGGVIWAEPNPTGGAMFRFWLPIDDEQPQLQPDECDAGHGPRSRRRAG